MKKEELRNHLKAVSESFSKTDEDFILNEGKNITSILAELALEFNPDNIVEEKAYMAGTAMSLIGKIGHLDEADVQKIHIRFISGRSGAESQRNGWGGVWSDTVDTLQNLGYTVVK